jgi:hypothetical protein
MYHIFETIKQYVMYVQFTRNCMKGYVLGLILSSVYFECLKLFEEKKIENNNI